VIIRKALEGLEGVEKASISYSKKEGEVFFDPDMVTEKEIVNKKKLSTRLTKSGLEQR
jgi:copper chaperone CopZ